MDRSLVQTSVALKLRMRMARPPEKTSGPIGIFDSGWGGLSVWQSLVSALPGQSIVYVGDHRYLPYGSRTTAQIRDRALRIIGFLRGRGAKLVVVACNTATIAGIDVYRAAYPGLPIIGVVPVIKTAAERTRTKKFIVLSTDLTAKSSYQKQLVDQFASDCTVSMVGSSLLVPLIEAGETSSERIRKELLTVLGPYLHRGVDIVVLGCTHFPFVLESIRAIVGDAVAILDSGDAVARHTQRILAATGKAAVSRHPVYEFFTTGNATTTGRVAAKLIQKRIHVHHVTI